MELLDTHLRIQRSTIPGSGKGLFTNVDIPKGTVITEYLGKVTNWNDVDHKNGTNLYIYYVSRNHVINAQGNKEGFAHFANDAKGPTRIKGILNNAEYVVKKKRVFLTATKNIPAKSEIFVAYGQEYWDILKENGML